MVSITWCSVGINGYLQVEGPAAMWDAQREAPFHSIPLIDLNNINILRLAAFYLDVNVLRLSPRSRSSDHR